MSSCRLRPKCSGILPIFPFGKHNGCAVGRYNSEKKYGTPTNKVSLQTKSGAGNTMVMSELTGGGSM